jgi:TRAP-type C4-dicarboxylate transport system substrate-binding protein
MTCRLIAAALAVVSLSLTPAVAEQPIIIKFSHVVAPDTPKGQGAAKFAELTQVHRRQSQGRGIPELAMDARGRLIESAEDLL